MKNKKKSKYAVELERLRELSAIEEVLKKSDIENAALTNTSKDSETVNDNVLDTMLEQLNLNKNANKDLEIVESLMASPKEGRMPSSSSKKSMPQGKKTAPKKMAKNNTSKGKKKKR